MLTVLVFVDEMKGFVALRSALAVLAVCSHAGKFDNVIDNVGYGSSYMPESAFIPPTIERNCGINSRPVDKALHTGLGMPAA